MKRDMSHNKGRPVIFLAFANDRDDTVRYLRNLPEEARRIREPLQRARRDGLCELVELANATADDIFRVFQDPEYRDRIALFHYGGHANGYQLLLESADGSSAAADAGGLAAFLGQQKGLELVFLNGCSTQQQVQGLLDADVSAVIATSRAIDDQVAMQFARHFYQGLAGGANLRTAYNEAEAAVQTSQGGDARALYFGDADQPKLDSASADRWPWELYFQEGADAVANWSLPEAAGDPLFGLPQLPEQDLPANPFRNLSWFDREHAELFFGRGHQIRELYDLVTSTGTAPIVLLYGQSGVGKSSMLAAGLIPRLEQSCEVRYLRRDQHIGLLETLRSTFVAFGSNRAPTGTVDFAKDWLEMESRLGKPLVVILDQVEEAFTLPNPKMTQEMDDFLNHLEATFGNRQRRPMGRLILSFRKEWLAEVNGRLLERRLPRARVFLERLGRRGVMEAVLGPTTSQRLMDQYGLTVEEGLAEIIADDLLADAESAIAPTLQILLTKMWEKATAANYEHPHFNKEVYRNLKRAGVLLRDFLDQQIETFREPYPQAVDSGLLLDILALHTTPLGTADQWSEEQLQSVYAHLDEALSDFLRQCQDLHLLTRVADGGPTADTTTRLAHDTLAPLIRQSFDQSCKPGQRARRILDNRVVDWQEGREGTPLDEADLAVVERGVSGTRTLTPNEQRLVAASRQLRARLNRSRKILKTAAAVAVAIIAITAGIALWERNAAVKARDEAALHLREAREAVDRYFTVVSQDTLLNQPGTQKLRKQLLADAKSFFEDFAAKYVGDAEVEDGVAIAYFNLGRISEEVESDHEAALANYEKARLFQATRAGPIQERLESSLAGTKLPQAESDLLAALGNTLTAMGRAHYQSAMAAGDTGLLSAALDEYADAVKIRKLLCEHARGQSTRSQDELQRLASYQRRLADANMNLGVLKQTVEDCKIPVANYDREADKTALDHFNEAQRLRAELLDDLKTDPANSDQCLKVQRERARGFYNLARLYSGRARAIDGVTAASQALAESGMEDAARAVADYEAVLEETPNDFEAQRDLAQTCILHGKLVFDYRDDGHQEGLDLVSQASALSESLVELNPQVVSYRETLGWAYDELGVRQKKDGQHDKARESLQRAVDILEECPYKGLAKSAIDEAREELAGLDSP